MRKLTWILLMVLTACGKPEGTTTNIRSIDPVLLAKVEQFEALAREHGKVTNPNLVVEFVDAIPNGHDNYLGYCYNAVVNPRVVILRSWWEKETNFSREALLFHELGHCLLGLPHVTDSWEIMSEEIVSTVDDTHRHYYINNRRALIDNLFR